MTTWLFSAHIQEIFEIKCLQIVNKKRIVLCPLENNTKRIPFIATKELIVACSSYLVNYIISYFSKIFFRSGGRSIIMWADVVVVPKYLNITSR